MTIPDYISPVVAYRVWQWDAAGLKSLNSEPWIPGHCLAAACRRYESGKVGDEAALLDGHEPPHDGCTCGVYAAKDLNHLRRIGYAEYGVHGEVYLWGKVVEHRFGWRAQFAYPKTLVLPPDAIPFKMSEVEPRLETLMPYGANIAIASTASTSAPIPLWSGESGYNESGLHLLMEDRKRRYSCRAEERRLKRDDRVAVLGEGIGVVASADNSEVRVLIWNKSLLWLPRKQVRWNEQNWRWETDATAVLARRMWGVAAAASAAAG